MHQAFLDYYRCSEIFANFTLVGTLSEDFGYFRFGQDTICYGRCSSGFRAKLVTDELYDAFPDVRIEGSTVRLPFDPTEIIEDFRNERYVHNCWRAKKKLGIQSALRSAYYFMRPLIPSFMRRQIQRMHFRSWKELAFPNWPVDRTVEGILQKLLILSIKAQRVDTIPFIWFWPEGIPSCAIITHDVETSAGMNFCSQLMDLNDSYGIKSSFQIVPEGRYTVSQGFRSNIVNRGFELNVHDLNHDGRLFSNRERFLRRAKRINHYGQEFGALGFRSAILYRNVNWYDALDFSYDSSVPNVAHLDPQRGGCCTVMPYFIGRILELPVTTTQDYSLFHILNDYSMDLWKQQIALITEEHGLANFIVHPDYVDEKPAQNTYKALLHHLSQLRSDGRLWIALPNEVNRWWRERSQMQLVRRGNGWYIEGVGKEQARVAYARVVNDRIVYTLE